jgi:putative endonuclease
LSLRAAGRKWEGAAESFLRRHGLKTQQRNYHCRHGEIDLIMRDDDCLVFVEVRYRRRPEFGSGAETVSPLKQSRIARTAAHFLCRHRRFASQPCRFDVISMDERQGRVQVRWIRNAFEAGPQFA